MRFGRIGLLTVVLTLLCTCPAFGQNATGAIKGTVVDQSEAVIKGASVIVKNRANGSERKLVTGAQGTFWFENLAPGD